MDRQRISVPISIPGTVMEVTGFGSNLGPFPTKFHCRSQFSLLSGDSVGVSSSITSKIKVGKLRGHDVRNMRIWIPTRKGQGISVNNYPRYENLKPGSCGALPASLAASSEQASDEGAPFQVQRPSLRPGRAQQLEEFVEKLIFNCRFFTLLAVAGSLSGSFLCFLKGCGFVFDSFKECFLSGMHHHGFGKVILLLVQAIDVYLMGTVMLIFGMGLYELFINSLEIPDQTCTSQVSRGTKCGSNLFGLFKLQERPRWLEIQSLEELKTKLGHVIVMVLLVGMFEKSKTFPINSGLDLLCFAGSVLMSAGCLFLLSKLESEK